MDLARASSTIHYTSTRDDSSRRPMGGRFASRMITRSYLLLFLALLVIPSLVSMPLTAFTQCGLLLAHDHILLGGANEGDLLGHLQGEAACVSGKAAISDGSAPRTSTREKVVSVIRTDLISFSAIIGVGYPMLVQTVVIVPECSTRLCPWWAGQSPTKAYSLVTPPLDPPPNSA